jgi:hypothetical protein
MITVKWNKNLFVDISRYFALNVLYFEQKKTMSITPYRSDHTFLNFVKKKKSFLRV